LLYDRSSLAMGAIAENAQRSEELRTKERRTRPLLYSCRKTLSFIPPKRRYMAAFNMKFCLESTR